jgi:GntR family transcriptional regulator/MocR family aminotransferase
MYYNLKPIIVTSEYWNAKADAPLYMRLYYIIKNAIIKRIIPENIKIPSSRILANDLNVSRSTIIKTYELLLLEKYIVSKIGSGYTTASTIYDSAILEKPLKEGSNYPAISKKAISFQKNKPVLTDKFSMKNIAFRPGLPPLDLFPVEKWSALSKKYWKECTPSILSNNPTEGLESLRQSVAEYLKLNRNIDCDYQQVFIVQGTIHSLYLIGNVLLDKHDKIIMENPTYPRAYKLFKSLKASIIPCSIDNEGININSIHDKNVKLIITTPSNQFPLSIKMSLNRRLELLGWASKQNSLIIEEDHDHEFCNLVNPIPSIFSLDQESRVIYQGTFNKLLHPSLGISYVIVPKYLINPMKAISDQSTRFICPSNQEIMHQFIKKDYLNQHIRNVMKIAGERRKLFIQQTHDSLEIDESFEGLHLIGKVKSGISDKTAFELLLKEDVAAYPLSNYYITKEKKEGLVIGYSSVNTKVMIEKTKIINTIIG